MSDDASSAERISGQWRRLRFFFFSKDATEISYLRAVLQPRLQRCTRGLLVGFTQTVWHCNLAFTS